MNYNTTKKYILYQVINEQDQIVYIGSSGLQISALEYNHRNYKTKGYKPTRFRLALEQHGSNWTFSVLHNAHRTREQTEYLEGIAIREALPKYNDDLFPLESSKQYGRI